MPMLRDRSVSEPRGRVRDRVPRLNVTKALVVAQMAISLFLLVAAGLFVQTLANLQAISLGFNRERVLLFQLNAPQAGYPESRVAALYADLRRRFGDVPGVRDATLSHASLIRAGRSFPITVDGVSARGTRLLFTGPRFFATMQIPLLRGRDIAEGVIDRQGTPPVVVVSDLFARAHFGRDRPDRTTARSSGRRRAAPVPHCRGRRRREVRRPQARDPTGGLPAVRPASVAATAGDDLCAAHRRRSAPLRTRRPAVSCTRRTKTACRLTNIRTQEADIDRTINQEIVLRQAV